MKLEVNKIMKKIKKPQERNNSNKGESKINVVRGDSLLKRVSQFAKKSV